MLRLTNHSTDPAFNLALEEHFTARAAALGDSLFFFWRNRPSVIVGRFQNSFAEIDRAAAHGLGIEVYRRNSGGGAVYHDLSNLNYSLIIPAGCGNYLRDAKSGAPFDLLFDTILALLASLGVRAQRSGRNDLTLDGRKISGAARQLTKSGLLLHGTLLFDADLDALGRVLAADSAKYESKGLKSVRSRVCNLKNALPPGMDISAFQAALEAALPAGAFTPGPADLAAIEELAAQKYRNWDWNWGASPPSSLCRKRRFAWGGLELHLDISGGIIKSAAVYGDFFSNAATPPPGTPPGMPDAPGTLDALTRGLCGKRHQSAELEAFLRALPLEEIFLGAARDEIISFFLE